MALFSKLDGMMQNSLPVNLLLTGVIARLASYPQPLLRSFLLSHNLVFQPTVKSLLQVQNGLYVNVDSSIYAIALHVYSDSTGAKQSKQVWPLCQTGRRNCYFTFVFIS